MTQISLNGLSKAKVLAALYNASAPQGMGFLHYDPTPMTEAEAQQILDDPGGAYFDYLNGRVMKIDLSGDTLRTDLYNRDNGPDAADRVLASLIASGETNSIQTQASHQLGTSIAADKARAGMGQATQQDTSQGIPVITMGLADVADVLGPAVERAVQ